MIGAREYHALFSGKSQQVGRLYLRFGYAKSRKTFEIYVLPKGTIVKSNESISLYTKAVKVYGALDDHLVGVGNGTFSQACGWLEFGPWQHDFELIVADKKAERRALQIDLDKEDARRKAEADRIKAEVLGSYGKW